ncbi:MAG: hypothetical protein LBH80_06280 [Prevotellaceae bacterium]|jgi:hypothetical protein|nr:hypothetical protein [Prevotellaceae bacterium]
MKTAIKILLLVAIIFLAYLCVNSIITPIRFESQRKMRELPVIQRLVDLRKAEIEYREQKGAYTDNFDTLIQFLKTGKKAEVLKEGALTDAQLEAGLTEAKAVAIIKKGNAKEIATNGLEGFRRDTAYVDLIAAIYPHGEYTHDNINRIMYIPFSNEQKFELQVKNDYVNPSGIPIPLFQATAHFSTFLSDLDRQEIINLVDRERQLDKYPGLKVGDIDIPNNNAGNWE